MSGYSRIRDYTVGIASFLYGTAGYGLSVFVYLFGLALGRFLPESRVMAYPVHVTSALPRARRTKVVLTRPVPSSQPRHSSGVSSSVSHSCPKSDSVKEPFLELPRSYSSLPPLRVPSFHSFDHLHSFASIVPAVTMTHPNHADRPKPVASSITEHPASGRHGKVETSSVKPSTKARRTLPFLYIPPKNHMAVDNAERSTSRFSIRTPPSIGRSKPKLPRSASSPQLTEFRIEQQSPFPMNLKQESNTTTKAQSSIFRKTSREKPRSNTIDSVISQSCSRFFRSKNVHRTRSQVLRSQPYNIAPHFVALPTPIASTPTDSKEGKGRLILLPSERAGRHFLPHTTPEAKRPHDVPLVPPSF